MSAQHRSLGDLLRRHRLAAGLSQAELAERAGLSRRGVSDLERGVITAPHHDTIVRLADALALADAERAALQSVARGRLIQQGGESPHRSRLAGALAPALVGRQRELALIERHLAGEAAPWLLFAGEPGIGKSRLLEEAARRASGSGWRVVHGGCTRQSGQAPYEPLVSALARAIRQTPQARLRMDVQGCSWLVRLIPELLDSQVVPAPAWSLPPEQERRLLIGAVARYLANVAGPAGTLLLLDDLQWAGADALALLEALVLEASEAESRPLLRLLGAYRSTEVHLKDPLGLLLADHGRDGHALRHSLPLLTIEEASDLLAQLWPVARKDAEAVEQQAAREETLRRAEGLPFYLVSSARAAQDARDITSPDMVAGSGQVLEAPEVPASVSESVQARVAVLPEAARRLVGIAAVAGRVIFAPVVMAVSARPEDETLEALDVLVQAGLLVEESAETYRFTHDLIQEAVEGALGSQRRRMLHRRLAEELQADADHNRNAAEIATHFIAAGESKRALPYVLLAGDQAEAIYAHEEAEAWYRNALGIASAQQDWPRQADIAFRLANMLRQQTRYDDALTLLDLATTRYQAVHDVRHVFQVQGAILELCGERGAFDEGLARAASLLERAGQHDAGSGDVGAKSYDVDASHQHIAPGLAAFFTGLATFYFYAGHNREQLDAAHRAVHEARAAGSAYLTRYALQAQALAAWYCESDPVAAARRFEEVRVLAEEAGDGDQLLRALSFLSGVYAFSGRLHDASACDQLGWELTERFGGHPTRLALAIGCCGENDLLLGEWERGRALLNDAAIMMRQHDPAGTTWRSLYPHMWSGIIDTAQGREEDGLAHLDAARALAERYSSIRDRRQIQSVLAEYDLVCGHAGAAYARLLPLLDRPGLEEPAVSRWLLALVAWAELLLGRIDDADARVAECLARSMPGRCYFARPDACRVQALLAIKLERWSEARAALEEAIAVARPMPYPYAEAKALWAYGQLEVARGNQVAAHERFTAALAICDRLGERMYAQRIERDLAALGMA